MVEAEAQRGAESLRFGLHERWPVGWAECNEAHRLDVGEPRCTRPTLRSDLAPCVWCPCVDPHDDRTVVRVPTVGDPVPVSRPGPRVDRLARLAPSPPRPSGDPTERRGPGNVRGARLPGREDSPLVDRVPAA